jgi:hypothetical protein
MPFALLGHDVQAVPKLYILAMCLRSGSSKIAAYLFLQGDPMVNATNHHPNHHLPAWASQHILRPGPVRRLSGVACTKKFDK